MLSRIDSDPLHIRQVFVSVSRRARLWKVHRRS